MLGTCHTAHSGEEPCYSHPSYERAAGYVFMQYFPETYARREHTPGVTHTTQKDSTTLRVWVLFRNKSGVY